MRRLAVTPLVRVTPLQDCPPPPWGDLQRGTDRSGMTVRRGRPRELGAPGRYRGGQAPAPHGAGALRMSAAHPCAPSPTARRRRCRHGQEPSGHMPLATASHANGPAAAIPRTESLFLRERRDGATGLRVTAVDSGVRRGPGPPQGALVGGPAGCAPRTRQRARRRPSGRAKPHGRPRGGPNTGLRTPGGHVRTAHGPRRPPPRQPVSLPTGRDSRCGRTGTAAAD